MKNTIEYGRLLSTNVSKDIECRQYHALNMTDVCAFMRSTPDCAMEDGFINYLTFVFCSLPASYEVVGLIIMFMWWLILFIALASTADKFFCPSLAVISKTLRMSDNLAGVTFLAFGNGAPDIFSAISAVGSVKDGDVGLAFGALLGAGIYVSTVVAGSIALARPFKAMERPLLKDIVFYIAAVFWTFTILFKQKIYTWEAFGFIGFYVVYVAVTLIARAIHQRYKQPRDPANAPLINVTHFSNGTEVFNTTIQDEDATPAVVVTQPQDSSVQTPAGSLRSNASNVSHSVGIIAPNYMARWVVAHDLPEIFGENPHNDHHHHHTEARVKRSHSLTHAPVAIPHAAALPSPSIGGSLDSQRPRTRSDMGPGRRNVQDDIFRGQDNPAFIANESAAASGDGAVSERLSNGGDLSGPPGGSLEVPSRLPPTHDALSDEELEDEKSVEAEAVHMPPMREFLYGIVPIDMANWHQLSAVSKCYEIIKAPVLFLLLIVTPIVDCDLPKRGWNKYRILINSFLAPNFCFLVTKVSFIELGGYFPVGVIVLLVSCLLPVVIFFTSRPEREPPYHAVFAFLGFATSIIWIYCIANEIVNILEAWGIVFNISNAVLGLTFLAWGNSIGDTISNVVMAKEGYPRMAISACFGGPLFNLLLGIGIPFSILTLKTGGSVTVVRTSIEFVLIGGLLLSLLSSLILLPLRRFQLGRVYGVYLLCVYFAFLTVAILAESKVIVFNI